MKTSRGHRFPWFPISGMQKHHWGLDHRVGCLMSLPLLENIPRHLRSLVIALVLLTGTVVWRPIAAWLAGPQAERYRQSPACTEHEKAKNCRGWEIWTTAESGDWTLGKRHIGVWVALEHFGERKRIAVASGTGHYEWPKGVAVWAERWGSKGPITRVQFEETVHPTSDHPGWQIAHHQTEFENWLPLAAVYLAIIVLCFLAATSIAPFWLTMVALLGIAGCMYWCSVASRI